MMYVSHPECGSKIMDWPVILIPSDLCCQRCGQSIDLAAEACDASIASGQPHHMQCPAE